jgi:hypothetical protein
MAIHPGLRTVGILLSPAPGTARSAEIALVACEGVPSGGTLDNGQSLDAAQRAVCFRTDGTASTLIYVTPDGGTTWTACDPAAMSGLDLNGTELILDADADTSITADTNDQIDVKIGGADDFRIIANIFRALAGSSIQTDTIDETTGAAGVTIDSLLVKDGQVQGTDITDPGDAGAIGVNRSGSVSLVTAGAETRTLAIPTAIGQTITLYFQTDGGDCVVTVASAINAAGNTVITLNDANDSITLRGVHTGAALAWRVIVNDGCTLS